MPSAPGFFEKWKKHCITYVETGTRYGDSMELAVAAGFDLLIGIDRNIRMTPAILNSAGISLKCGRIGSPASLNLPKNILIPPG